MNFSKVSDRLNTNNLSINIDRHSFLSFNNFRQKEKLPLNLPFLSICGLEIKQITSTKLPRAKIDDNINWEERINLVQNKISKALSSRQKNY